MVTNIRDLQVRDDFIVTIAGTVAALREDEFLLQDSTGQVWVDVGRGNAGRVDLAIGEQVTVIGDLDDLEDFDAVQVIRSNGSGAIVQPPATPEPSRPAPPARPSVLPDVAAAPAVNIGGLPIRDDVFVTIQGSVAAIREDEFLLQDATGQIWVDPDRAGIRAIDLAVGESVSVVGDRDDTEDFDAVRITRSNALPTNGAVDGRRLVGNGQSNRLIGSSRNDAIDGNGGRDILNGRAGDDILVGGQGRDRLIGGQGRDRFVYESIRDAGDVITDFGTTDTIDLSQIFSQPQYASPNSFSDYVQLQQTAGGTIVRIDVDGDLGNGEFRTIATLTGINAGTLNASQFLG